MTHEEAAVLFPLREVFLAGQSVSSWGVPFRNAKVRASSLGLVHVEGGESPVDGPPSDGPDGMILPGTHDGDPAVLPRFPMLMSVTLYYRPRAGVAVAR